MKEQNIEPSKKSFYVDCFLESLNCHHNDISDYFFENYVEEYLKSSISEKFKINYESALFRVCLENYNFSRFNLVKNKFYDYQFLNENGILYISCKYGYNGLLKFLISQEKIDINHQEVIQKNGMILTKKQSVIFTALAKNDIELIKLILSHQKIDVNQKCIEERFPYFYDNDYSKLKEQTILNIAIEKNLIDVVKILLSKQEIDVNLKSKIEENDPSIFLSHNRIIEENTPLSTAVANKNKEIIKLLLSKNEIDINQKLIRLNHLEYSDEKIIEKTALSMAIDINDKELINLILSHPKIDINQKYDTQLYDKIMIDNDLDDLDDFKFDDCNKYELKKKIAERNTILNLVIKRRNKEIAQILLSRADINLNENEIIDYYEHGSFKYKTENNSALNIAIENECIDVIKLLLMKKEININFKSTIEKHGSIIEEKSPLSTAIEKGNKDIVELLLCREDIDINQKLKKTFQEPIYFSIGAHNDDDYEYIVEKIENNYSKNNIKIIEKTVLFIAFEKNNAEIVLLLLKQPKIDIDLLTDQRNNKIALFLAIKMKSPQIVKLLLSNPKIDVNQKAIISNSHFTVYSQCSVVGCYTIEESPLHLAVKMQNIEIIKLLLNVKEINVNCIISTRGKKSTNEASLHTAIKLNNLEIVQLLLSKPEIDVNIKLVINEKNDHDNERKIEVTPICLAVRKNNLEMLKLLLFTNKIDLNTKLIYSCNECIEMETFYDDFGMEICKPFKNKYTYIEKSLFQIAVDNGNLEIVNFLLSYLKSDINEIFVVKETIKNLKNKKCILIKIKKTALIQAILQKNVEMVKFLLSQEGINVNCRSIITRNKKRKIMTPLHLSVISKNVEIIKLLLDHKDININCTDEQGRTPIQLTEDKIIKDIFIVKQK